ncbi:cell surface glycoprotein CD200 receptor 2-like [Chionomys nivalis]|uniref:cell surface glycoprotein CD200 receptor 2-like n=1 Tax=Chionomys nivalis TaxID=269649 RepID=UPI002597666E|nr:cell surface glycoprotein CD200 receptor 2-like [Chionomys nivalis]
MHGQPVYGSSPAVPTLGSPCAVVIPKIPQSSFMLSIQRFLDLPLLLIQCTPPSSTVFWYLPSLILISIRMYESTMKLKILKGLRRYLTKSADFSLFVIVIGQQTQVPPTIPKQEPPFPESFQMAADSCECSCTETQTATAAESAVNTTLFVQMGAKALLCCPALPMTKAVLIAWVIAPRGQPPCRISYRVDTKENNEANCMGRRITWTFIPDQRHDLQINAVALGHDGLYSCEIATPKGNFLRRHDLQVLVPPAVTLLPGENRTVVCEAIAGKPAAQIFWIPDGDHVTKQETHSNGTVAVRSTYPWEQNNVSAVFCLVSHPTGNQTLSIELNQGVTSTLRSLLTILYVKLSLLGIILLILGFAFFQKRNYFSAQGQNAKLLRKEQQHNRFLSQLTSALSTCINAGLSCDYNGSLVFTVLYMWTVPLDENS